MILFLCFAVLITVVFPEPVFPCVLENLLDMFCNGTDCSDTQVFLANIRFILYTRKNQQNGVLLNNANFKTVNPQNRVIFIIHGWLQGASQGWIIQMKETYLNKEACNVIIVDWSDYSNEIDYGASFCAVPQVGIFTGDLIYNLMITRHINLQNTQIIGCSLGAHVGGHAGQQIQIRTGGFKIERIIGLDAAGPGFLGLAEEERLDARDALFVQGIHTSNCQFGYSDNYGTVDFHLNCEAFRGCGAAQPGCPFYPGVPMSDTFALTNCLAYFFCNHVRAVVYYIESINSTSFIGSKCGSGDDFQRGLCKFSPTFVMGENCPSTACGQVFLYTNWEQPFALGIMGIPD